jgi:hypothetical protein
LGGFADGNTTVMLVGWSDRSLAGTQRSFNFLANQIIDQWLVAAMPQILVRANFTIDKLIGRLDLWQIEEVC